MNLELQNHTGVTIPVTFATVRDNIIVVAWTATVGVGRDEYECRLQDGRVVRNSKMRHWRLTDDSLRKVQAVVGKPVRRRKGRS